MATRFAVSLMILSVLALSGCGGVETTLVTPPNNIGMFKQVTLIQPQVASEEQEPDDLAMNARLGKLAADELLSMLVLKNIAATTNCPATVECRVDIVYGSRAQRYFLGFGAGTGHVRITIQLRDASGTVRYATRSEADLAVGAFGGDMSDVVRDAIKEAVQDFGSRL